jgi:hypothetical protein
VRSSVAEARFDMGSAGKDVTRCKTTITNTSGGEVTVADAHTSPEDKWVAPGDPTGKRIDEDKTFDDAQPADAKPGHCGIELGVEPTKGDGRWKVLVKATPDGGDVVCQVPRGDYSC